MLYRGYWMEFVDLTPSTPDGSFDAVFLTLSLSGVV